MTRILVDIPDQQMKDIAAIAAAEELSRAEVVRRAVTAYIEQQKIPAVNVFGIWRDRKADALECQERVRSEW